MTSTTAANGKHTPGPWYVCPECAYGWDIHSVNGNIWVGDAKNSHDQQDGFPTTSEGEANAQLISAAPDMQEALNACDKAFAAWQVGQIPGRPEDILALISEVRAALAKSRGETP